MSEEISEGPTLPPPGPPPPEDSSSSSRRPTQPGTKRLFLTLSVLLCFLSGLPFLLKSTEIYRFPLPFHSIESLSTRLQTDPPSLPCRFQAVFLRSDRSPPDSSIADTLAFLVSKELRSRTATDPVCGGCGKNYTVSVTVDSGTDCVRSRLSPDDSWQCGAVELAGLDGGDEVVDELLHSALERAGGKDYTVVVLEREEEVRVVVGKHRHGWIVGNLEESDAVERIGEIFVKFFMNGGMEEGEGKGEFMPVGLDGSVVLSFSLLNADPNNWVYDW